MSRWCVFIIGLWERLSALAFANLETVLICLIVGLVILAISFLMLWLRLASLQKRYRKLMWGKDRLNLEELFNHLSSLVKQERQKNETYDSRLKILEAQASRFIGIGLVRYNAFQDTGSDLSFSLALLNRSGDGAVITSLFGREENRLYGKPIEQGGSRHPLSEEEQAALQKAQEAIGCRVVNTGQEGGV